MYVLCTFCELEFNLLHCLICALFDLCVCSLPNIWRAVTLRGLPMLAARRVCCVLCKLTWRKLEFIFRWSVNLLNSGQGMQALLSSMLAGGSVTAPHFSPEKTCFSFLRCFALFALGHPCRLLLVKFVFSFHVLHLHKFDLAF